MKKALPIILIAAVMACDRVTDDTPLPEISYQSIVYTRDNGKAVIGLFGDFDRDGLVIETNTNRATQIADLPYVGYSPDINAPAGSENIEVQLQKNNRLVGRANISVVNISESDCVNSAFSDYHVIENDSTLIVDLLQNDYFCDFQDTGTGGVNMVPIANAEGSLIAISAGSATLSYTAPEGFTGTVELIYELCYGFPSNSTTHWSNPVERCRYYYTAIATIVVKAPL